MALTGQKEQPCGLFVPLVAAFTCVKSTVTVYIYTFC